MALDDYRNTFGDNSLPFGALNPGGSNTGLIDPAGDIDLFAVTLVVGTTYTFDLIGQAGGTLDDVSLGLRDSGGGYITGTSGFDSKAAHILYTATISGTFYLEAGGIFSETGGYTVSASAGIVDDYHDSYDSTLEAAGAIAPGGGKTGLIETPGDIDVFQIALVAGTTYSFDLAGQAGSALQDTSLTLRNDAGNYLSSTSGFNPAPAHILYTATVSGAFYLGAEGIFQETGAYTLTASSGFIDDYRDTYDNTVEALGAIAPGGSKTGLIETPGDVDVFAVSLVAGTTYNIDMAGKAGGGIADTSLTVRDAAGQYLTSDSGFGADPAHILYTPTASATYYLSVEGIFSETGGYTLSVGGSFVDDYRDTYGDTSEALGAVSPGGSATGTIETADDTDIFAVSLIAGRTYTFEMLGQAGGTLADVSLSIANDKGLYGNSASGFDGKAASFAYTAAATGTFYLAADSAFSETGAYKVSVSSGYVDDYRDSYNDPSEPLGTLALGGSKTGNIEIGGDRDVFAITLAAGQTYDFDLKGQAGGGGTLADPYLTLSNATGGQVASGASLGGAADDRITYTATTSGTYYLAAAGNTLAGDGSYTLSAAAGTATDDYRDSIGDTTAPLGALTVNGSKTGFIETVGDSDVFAISLTAGQTYTFDLAGSGGSALADPQLKLLNAGGALLSSNNDFNGPNARIVYTATANGAYYLDAESANGGVGTYLVSARTDFDDYRDSTGDTTAPLGSLSTSGSLSGSIETAGDKDFFAVTLTAGQSYTFDLTKTASGGLADSELRLYKSGALLVTNNDFNGPNSRIVYTADATATYYLDAHSATAAGVGGYVISSKVNADDFRDSITDTTAPLGTLAVNGSLFGSIEKAGDTDFFAVSLVAGKSYTFDLASNSAGGVSLANTDLRLFNGAGSKLVNNNDFNGTNSRIVYTAASTGTYYLDAHSISTTGTGNYQISAKLNFDDFRDSIADATAPAGTLAVNGSALGSIETAGDTDFFAVSLMAGQSYTFDLVGINSGGAALANTDLRLFSGAGSKLVNNNDFNGTNSRIVYTAASTGAYYLDAHGITTTGTGNYQISAKLNFDDARDTITDATAPFGAIAVNGSKLGSVETAGDKDIFAISLTAGQSYTFDLSGNASGGAALANTDLRLLNASGAILFSNNDFNGVNSRIVYTAASTGTFYLDAHGIMTTGTGNYLLSAKLNFDDARDAITDATAALTTLIAGVGRTGSIETGGDHDIFAISLTSGQTYTFDLVGIKSGGAALVNAELTLMTSGGSVLFTNDDFNAFNARIVYTATSTGTFYLDAHSHVATGSGNFLLTATPGFDDFRDTITDKSAAAGSLAVGASLNGAIETAGDSDVFAISLQAGHHYQIDLDGGAAAGQLKNGDLELLNSGGAQLAYNDDVDAGLDARIVFDAAYTGVHYINASGVGMNQGFYALSLNEIA